MGESYYEILEVGPGATRAEIESAYRERVLETHPDHSDDPDAAERFQRVQTAKSVLTDGTERAHYDRLGHDAYVGLARGPAGGADSSSEEDANSANDSSGADAKADRAASATQRTSSESSATGAATGGSATHNGGTAAGSRRRSTRSSGARTRSHHARQRSHRQRKKQRATGGWPFDGDRSSGNGTSNAGAEVGSWGATGADGDDESRFRYAVHDWDGTVDLEWEGQPIDGTTAVSVASIAFLYPMLVTASLTPLFSPLVNGIVAACTLLLVGYLLTMPRLAMATFGGWSVLFPVGMVGFSLVEPLSLLGLLALGFVWVPFGYAVALWWALRP